MRETARRAVCTCGLWRSALCNVRGRAAAITDGYGMMGTCKRRRPGGIPKNGDVPAGRLYLCS